MPDPKLRIEIETASTGNAPQQTAAGIKDVTNAANQAAPALQQASKGTQEMARGLGQSVEVGNAAVNMVTNLSASTQGGAAGFVALARGAFGAGVALKGVLASLGPIGAIAAGIGIALGLVSAALRKNEENAEAARKKLEELNQQKLDKAVAEQGKLRQAAIDAVEKIDAEFNALERIADAEANLRKSRIDADKELSPAEKDRQKLAIDRQREDEKRANLLGKEEAQARKLEDAALASGEAARKEAEAFARKKAALEELTAARKAATEAERLANLESGAQAASGMAGGGVSAETLRTQQAARERLRAAESGAAGLTPGMVDTEQEAKVKRMQEAADADKKRAQEARTAADLERETQAAENRRLKETRQNQDAAKREQSDAEKAAVEAAKAKRDAEIKRTPAALWNNRIASGGVDAGTAAEVAAAFPGYKFAEVPEWRRKQESPAMTPTSMADVAAEEASRRRAEEEKRRTSGGTMTTPDGRTIPVVAPTAPVPGGGTITGPGGVTQTFPAGGQPAGPGRGAYREPQGGSDNKTAEALQGTTEAVKSQDTGDATAKAAEELKAATEEAAKSQQQAAESTAQALDQTGAFARDITAAAAQLTSVTTRHTSEIAQLRSQIANMRSRA